MIYRRRFVMRGGITAVVAALTIIGAVSAVSAASRDVRPAWVLSPHAFAQRMEGNPKIVEYVALRGYPDWVEEVEVYSAPPLEAYEVRAYYLRLDREVTFTRAYLLGDPQVGLRLSERPIPAEVRERIQQARLAANPALRAELAAERAMAAADSAEQAADQVESTVARIERMTDEMERGFHHSLYK
jgi:hypothetical protein